MWNDDLCLKIKASQPNDLEEARLIRITEDIGGVMKILWCYSQVSRCLPVSIIGANASSHVRSEKVLTR